MPVRCHCCVQVQPRAGLLGRGVSSFFCQGNNRLAWTQAFALVIEDWLPSAPRHAQLAEWPRVCAATSGLLGTQRSWHIIRSSSQTNHGFGGFVPSFCRCWELCCSTHTATNTTTNRQGHAQVRPAAHALAFQMLHRGAHSPTSLYLLFRQHFMTPDLVVNLS